MNSLRVMGYEESWPETNRLLSEFVNAHFADSTVKGPVNILEAGCGQQWNLKLDIDYELTGCDLSKEAMEIRRERYGDLDNFIVGDLATVSIDDSSFDVIYCSYVLEHLHGAEAVIEKFFDWLKPGGLAILIFPDRDSVFGFITRMTPHWFHVFYYKYILKFPNAGAPGHNPFPTAYDPVTSRRGIHEFCGKRNLKIALEFGASLGIPKSSWGIATLIAATVKIIAAVSFGRLTDKHQNITLVIEKS